MQYRGFFYFFCVSCFFYSLLLGQVVVFQEDKNLQEKKLIIEKLLALSQKKETPYQIVETFLEIENPEKSNQISYVSSIDQGKITEEKGYNYYNDARFILEKEKKTVEAKSEEKSKISHLPLEEKEKQKVEKKEEELQKVTDLLPNLYTKKEKVVIHLNNEGFVSLQAEKKEYAAYLTTLAKKIFYNWLEFLPALQIKEKFIKTNPKGIITGVIALYFKKDKDQNYQLVWIEPFDSNTMNQLTLRSFYYLSLPLDERFIELEGVIVRFSVYQNLKAEAEFQFHFEEKKE